jgi:hypothetical protein
MRMEEEHKYATIGMTCDGDIAYTTHSEEIGIKT